MLAQISWTNYILTILLLSIVYYVFIAYKYYRKDIVKIFAGKKINGGESFSMDFQIPMLQSFTVEVRAFLFEAIRNNLNKEEIMGSIQMLIRKYPGVKDITFRNSVEHTIIEESGASIHLSENDLSDLWN